MAALTASEFGALNDNAGFHLPMPGLFADIDAGSGAVSLTDGFLEAAPDLRVKILQQWTRALGLQRESALVDMFREFAGPLRGSTIVEQIERFRQLCAHQAIYCPPDFAVLLQRF